MLLDCRPIQEKILKQLSHAPRREKRMGAVLIGEDPASISFLKQKEKVAKKLGITFDLIRIAAEATQKSAQEKIQALAADPSIGGIIVQLPVPPEYDRSKLIRSIPLEKDIDALRAGALVDPPAVGALKEILSYTNHDPAKGRVVVVGKGFLIGGPIIAWLAKKGIRPVVMGKTSFDASRLLPADLIISGTGVPGLIRGNDIREGALCIDFGYGRKDGKLSGDFDRATTESKAGYLTPVPGGTGPILVLKLFQNFFTLAL